MSETDDRGERAYAFHLGTDPAGELISLPVLSLDYSARSYDPMGIADLPGTLRGQLKRGDRLVFRPGQVQLRAGERVLAFWTATVGVIHPSKQWHGPEWLELAKAAIFNLDPQESRRRSMAALMARRFAADPAILER